MKHLPVLIAFLILVVGGGSLIGINTAPGEWYAQLNKPPFNPPNWIFGPVWTALYIAVAVAGWRVWTTNRSGLAMKLWGLQLALNFLWSPTFFALHMIALALVVVLALLATILAFIATTWRSAPLAAWLFVPYAAWVSFASMLNLSILALN